MKTICIYHSRDLDGWMSAAIVKKHYIEETDNSFIQYDLKNNIKNITPNTGDNTHDAIYFLGWDYGNEIPDLFMFDHIIMCDISFPVDKMNELYNSSSKLTWIDHHFSSLTDFFSKNEVLNGSYKKYNNTSDMPGIRDTEFAACELTWMYFNPNEKMPEIVRLLGRYDCFGHKGTNEELKIFQFQYGARYLIPNYKYAYDYLEYNIRNGNTVIERILEKGIIIYDVAKLEGQQALEKTAFSFIYNGVKVLAVNKTRFNPATFGIDYHSDGFDIFLSFFFDGKVFNFSIYNGNGMFDVSKIAKSLGGGGHKEAAGFILYPEQVQELIKEYGINFYRK